MARGAYDAGRAGSTSLRAWSAKAGWSSSPPSSSATSTQGDDVARSRRKPTTGRPPRAGAAAEFEVRLRVTEPERSRWQAAADKQGLSLSDLVRESVETCIARRKRTSPARS